MAEVAFFILGTIIYVTVIDFIGYKITQVYI